MGLFDFAKKLVDPGGFVFKSDSQKLAEKQYKTEKDIAYLNYEEQKRVNDENIRAQQEAFDYQKELNAMQMEREDTAVSRRVADLKASGLSPTLAAGSSASATPVHAGTAPQGVAPQMATPSDIKVQEAMFREGLAKDRMALAMTVLSNMADVSRTKAETELIRAQKDRYVAETPIELRLKTLSQELREDMNPIEVRQAKLDMDMTELKKVNEKLTSEIMESDIRLKAYEEVMKSWSAYFAPRQEEAKTKNLETEVKQKAVALEMAEFLRDKTKEAGVPIEMMSPAYKNYMSFLLAGKKASSEPHPTTGKPFKDTTAGKIIKKIFTKSPRFVP